MKARSKNEILKAYGWYWTGYSWRVRGETIVLGDRMLTFETMSREGKSFSYTVKGKEVFFPLRVRLVGDALETWYFSAVKLWERKQDDRVTSSSRWVDLEGKTDCDHEFGKMRVGKKGGRVRTMSWPCKRCKMVRKVIK